VKGAATVVTFCTLGLVGLGLVMLYSVSSLQFGTQLVSRQFLAFSIGMVGLVAIAMVDYRHLRRLSIWLGIAAILALVLVLFLGTYVNGAKRWFRLPGFQFQPSDFAKLALLVGVAHYGAHCQRLMQTFKRGLLLPGAVLGVVLGLLFLEPDWGTAALMAAVTMVVLIVAGARLRLLLPPLLVGVVLFAAMVVRDPMRSDRIYSWLHLEETKDKVGYQGWQARLALGAGGLSGVGFHSSTQKRLVPEHRTDFIFAILGEEFGYAGSLALIAAYVALFWGGLTIATKASDSFGQLLAVGISFLVGLQAFINLGVVSGALPNKGLTLPFVSYGGSSLIIMLCCIGILLSIARHTELPEAPGDLEEPLTAVAPAGRGNVFAS
jgi:cell division protein FtsW